jgi:hypothetical protein
MSKKTLLNENTIRRFWKLASIRPLNEMEYLRDEEEEEGLPEPALDEPPMGAEEGAPLDDLGAEEAPLDDLGAEEAPAGDVEAEVNVSAEDVPSLETAVGILQDILAVAGTQGEEGAPELDDEEPPLDDLEAEEVPSPLGENNEENLEENDLDPTRLEEVLKKITDRVTKRILRASLVNKINKK